MTVREFRSILFEFKESLQDKEIVIKAENGLLLTPTIKFLLKQGSTIAFTPDDIDKLIITYE